MKVENDAVLTCSACGIEGPHELLYLAEHLCASRCINCGKTQVYSGHIYTEYARDLAERTTHLPFRFAGDVLRHPTELVKWPFKALGKPWGLLREVNQVTAFERSRRYPTPGRRVG
ncbi:MAG TPA: hypothetical protein VFJ72_06270 [Rubrobacteraceae bacterium]|nr:hypothetical protein [Rubrobacteraceae bacterium]